MKNKIKKIIKTIQINFIYFLVFHIAFNLDKRFNGFKKTIKEMPPKNLESKLFIIAHYLAVKYADKKNKLRVDMEKRP